MNYSEQNWNHLFGEYTTEETAWYGCWTTYSPNQTVISSKQAVRSFRSNPENTVITHINRDESTAEKSWHLDRATCNLPDGVVHPAMPFMRALSFGAGATAWIVPRFIPGKPFGVEFFFRDGDWRTSVAIVYGGDGSINRIIHIREHLNCFSDEFPSPELSEISGNWSGTQYSMTPDLHITSEATHLSFDHSSRDKMISLSSGLIITMPEQITVNQAIQIATAQRTTPDELKYFAAHYTASGVLELIVSASLQQDI